MLRVEGVRTVLSLSTTVSLLSASNPGPVQRHPCPVAAYNEAEDQYQHLDRFEVVLVGADGIDTVMATHGHYFRSPVDS